eukprot:CAMPEP_0201501876 /NCGR_PEP_ID=MMETSP0151_2-20130828/83827_1 /ASSEMBLY_ACC=CAM_ASM_000257 /TAXON_ID=200890 /ORGANISM="Paramoeba atlantica, Strain 621/1 / CCAP 1560/9" /LENGTH=680 /DNA_ID=CAMNT_0047895425 /DNA_START=103 /DNA_END=2148 /DNA_ORIENTATION=+
MTGDGASSSQPPPQQQQQKQWQQEPNVTVPPRGRGANSVAVQQRPTASAAAASSGGLLETPSSSSSSTPTSSSSASSSVWTEHATPEGRKYWFNTKTQESTWEKPEDLKSALEKKVSSCPWKEYTSDNGKPYYYNSITKESSWTIPKELKDVRELENAGKPATTPSPAAVTASTQQTITNGAGSSSSSSQVAPAAAKQAPTESKKPSTSTTTVTEGVRKFSRKKYASKDEAIQAFHEMLEERDVSPDFHWNDVVKHVMDDPRYSALSTQKQKKAAFSEWADRTRKRRREERLKRDKKLRDDFCDLLAEKLESGDIDTLFKWKKAIPILEDDPRYQALIEVEREDYFEHYLYEETRRQKDKAKENAKENMEVLRQEMMDDQEITSTSQWRKISPFYKEKSKAFQSLCSDDRLKIFQDVIRERERVEDEERQKKKEEENRLARKARATFRTLLEEEYKAEEFTASTRFSDFLPKIEKESAYTELLPLPGSTPRELFYDYVEELSSYLREKRKKIEEILDYKKESMQLDGTFEDFQELLEKVQKSNEEMEQGEENDGREEELAKIVQSLPPFELKEIFSAMKEKLEHKEKHKQKKRKRIIESYKDLLRSSRVSLGPNETWETAKQKLEGHKAYDSLPEEDLKQQLFDEYMQKIEDKKRKRQKDDSDSERESDSKRRKKDEGEE